MTAAGSDLLHDPAGLVAADGARLLPLAATAGAQVRALIDQLADLPDLDRPRALVVAGAQAAADTELLRALVGPGASAPIVAVQEIPSWVGALDVVVVLARQVYDTIAARAVETAVRRGARVIVRCAGNGPVPGGGAVVLVPMMAVPEALAGPARLALLCAVAHRCGLMPDPGLASWPEALDSVAMACHPTAEGFVNPAVIAAETLTDGTTLLVGADPVSDAVAAAAADLLGELAGRPAGVLPSTAALTSPAVLRRAAAGRDLFADPLDGAPAPIAAALVTLDPADPAAVAVTAAVPGILTVAPDDPGRSNHRPDGPLIAVAGPRKPPEAGPPPAPGQLAAELLVRWSFAAVYLGLVAGQLPPLDSPDGLGRAGTSLGEVRGEERPAEHADPEDAPDRGFGLFGDER